MESTVFELADQLKALKDQKAQMETKIKEINKGIDQAQSRLLQSMIDEEVGKFDRSGFTFYSSSRVHASVRAGCKPQIMEWLKQSPYRDLVKEDVNARTLESWAREFLSENDELPDEIQDWMHVFEKQTISIRKAK
jgi:hypothetical protein